MTLVARTTGEPQAIAPAVREQIRALDAKLPIADVKTFRDQLNLSLFPSRVAAWTLGGFGVLALLLAAIGIYGVVSYSVAQRTREIGVRMALGAKRKDVLRLVLGQGLFVIAFGLALGLLLALTATRLIAGFLYGVGATDLLTFSSVPLLSLPFAEPDCMVWVWGNIKSGGNRASVSPPDFLDYRQQNNTFEEFAASMPLRLNYTGDGEPERLEASGVTGNYFQALGAKPAFGRTFLLENEKPGSDQVVVLGYSLWQKRFNGDPAIINKTITLDGRSCAVIGVMRPDFSMPRPADVWVPINFDMDAGMKQRKAHFLRPIGRLKAGVTMAQAQADTDAIARRLEEQYPESNSGWNLRLVSLREQILGNTRPTLFILFVAAGLVLAIAFTNLANLTLIRAAGRQKEIAVRTALGAGRWRIVRQMITESGLLSLFG